MIILHNKKILYIFIIVKKRYYILYSYLIIIILKAQIQGPAESPFAEGTYTLSINIPDRYPFEPPRVRFITPIYHPNIDSDGRICLDTLKMQPQGSWSPSININTLLLTIRVLMANPNADDGLVPEITEEYKRDRSLWKKKAQEHTISNAISHAVISKNDDSIENKPLKVILETNNQQKDNNNNKNNNNDNNVLDDDDDDDDDDDNDDDDNDDDNDDDDGHDEKRARVR